jgi:hypothetical protein
MSYTSFQNYALLQLDYAVANGSITEPQVIDMARKIINNISAHAVYCSISPAWTDELILLWKAGTESVTIYIEVSPEGNPEETIITLHKVNDDVRTIETPFSDINESYFSELNSILEKITNKVNKNNPNWKKFYENDNT